ncbi:hypothetical protein BCON_0380g00070 [Botryotinia convoluta]|uniref:Uncharacterized protein n=1 Tax=Botryotinia convoluta TaxID=54673 RepID=A0A4Z1H9W0_9HELO|nr:hypothetical protein BCON_0380g00070 [Botryotinia convoluta]
MATSSIQAANLFNVKGLVAVVTGGGSGSIASPTQLKYTLSVAEKRFLNLLDKGNKKGNVEQKSQVVATSSIGGFNRKAPGGLIYGQSKAATTHLMKQLGTQLAPYDIRCNTIAPGLFPSELAVGLIGDGIFAKDQIPLQRAGTEEDMAGCILFLTSRAGAYCTHAVIVVDGGRLSVMPSTW